MDEVDTEDSSGFILLIILLIIIIFIVYKIYKHYHTPTDNPIVKSVTSGSTTVNTLKDGSIQSQTVSPTGSVSTVNTAPDGSIVSSSDTAATIERLFTTPKLYETIAAQVLMDIILHKLKVVGSVTRSIAKETGKLVQNVMKAAAGDTARMSERLGVQSVERVAEEAVTKTAADLTIAGDSGPLAPFVEAAEIGINMITGYMDDFNLGGFANQTSLSSLNSMRDEINRATKTTFQAYGDYPVLYGPIDNMDTAVYTAQLTAGISVLSTARIAQIQAGWADGSIPKLPAGSTDDDFTTYFMNNMDFDAMSTAADNTICTTNGGVTTKNPSSSNTHCTWVLPSQCLARWPMQSGDTYYEFNTTDNMCEVASSAMRVKCEGMGQGVSYNFATGSCTLTDAYCARYGDDNGLKNGDCSESSGEQISDAIFGVTLTHSLVNIFGLGSYAPCPVGATTNGYLCSTDSCGPTQDKMNGMCYDKCDTANGFSRTADSFGNQVQGMCYKCDEGSPTTAGMCGSDSCPTGTEQGTGIGLGFCYPPCGPGKSSDGVSMCLDNCPVGYDTLVDTCQRNPQTITDPGQSATCPYGMETTVAGPAGECQATCGGGNQTYGGICYDPNVDTNNLSPLPQYKCRGNDHWDGALTCWEHELLPGFYVGPYSPSMTCGAGYQLVAGLCQAVNRGPQPAPQGMLAVGECNTPGTEFVNGMCYNVCTDGFTRSIAGSCFKAADTIGRNPVTRGAGTAIVQAYPAETQGPQDPRGISLTVSVRDRITPFPSTSQSDFDNSTLGKYVMELGNGIANGDIESIGKGMAGMYIVGNPGIVSLGASSLLDSQVSSTLS